jgi:hypothetical protein
MAKLGDTTALRLCLERILPPRKDRPISVTIPTLLTAADAMKASVALIAAVADGELTAAEASAIGALIQAHVKLLEVADLERRITALEEQGTAK